MSQLEIRGYLAAIFHKQNENRTTTGIHYGNICSSSDRTLIFCCSMSSMYAFKSWSSVIPWEYEITRRSLPSLSKIGVPVTSIFLPAPGSCTSSWRVCVFITIRVTEGQNTLLLEFFDRLPRSAPKQSRCILTITKP